MDPWTALGIFIFGAAAGAVTTMIFYSAQMRMLRRLLETLAPKTQTGLPGDVGSSERRKSA